MSPQTQRESPSSSNPSPNQMERRTRPRCSRIDNALSEANPASAATVAQSPGSSQVAFRAQTSRKIPNPIWKPP